jgi:hypothetical protein
MNGNGGEKRGDKINKPKKEKRLVLAIHFQPKRGVLGELPGTTRVGIYATRHRLELSKRDRGKRLA